jgi:NDP-sugar pyrophosphorylase family protein
MEAIILAGGKGTRLGSLTKNKPKSLVEVGGKPIMDYIILNLLQSKQITRIILDVPKEYINEFVNRYGNGNEAVKIECVVSSESNTAEALQYDIGLLKEKSFILLMGDIVFDINVDTVINYYNMHNKQYNVIVVTPYSDESLACKFKDNFIVGFTKKKIKQFVAGGIYIFNKDDIDGKMVEYFDSVLPILAKQKKLLGYKFFGYMKGINTPQELNEVDLDVRSGKVVISWV